MSRILYKNKKQENFKERRFNNFFTNVGPNLAKNIPLPKNYTTIYDYLEENIEHNVLVRACVAAPIDVVQEYYGFCHFCPVYIALVCLHAS